MSHNEAIPIGEFATHEHFPQWPFAVQLGPQRRREALPSSKVHHKDAVDIDAGLSLRRYRHFLCKGPATPLWLQRRRKIDSWSINTTALLNRKGILLLGPAPPGLSHVKLQRQKTLGLC
jgi:hypothetical protein